MSEDNYRDQATMRRLERELEEKREKLRKAEASLQEDLTQLLENASNKNALAKDVLNMYKTRDARNGQISGDLANIRKYGGSEGGLFGLDDNDY